jgi:predicted dinucleotide-binding enzyme
VRPGARVLRAFRPGFAGVLPGQNSDPEHNVYLAGDDAEAKRLVAHFVKDGGVHAIDAGPLRRARELEAV